MWVLIAGIIAPVAATARAKPSEDGQLGPGNTTPVSGIVSTYQEIVPAVTYCGSADPIDGNDTLATATLTGLVGVGSVTVSDAFIGDGEFPDRDVDLYLFEIDEPSVPVLATIEVHPSLGSLDTYLRLFDAAGTQLAYNDDRSFSDFDPRVQTYLLETGVYYVGVSSSANPRYDNTVAGSGRPGPTGLYTLTLTTEAATWPSSPYEPNDRASTATPMGSVSFVVSDEFIGDGEYGRRDIDTYLLTLTGPARIDVEVHAAAIDSPLDPIVRLRSCEDSIEEPTWPDFCALGTNDDGVDGSVDSALAVGVPEAGDVYIMVSGADNRRYDPAHAGTGEIGSVGYYDLIVTVSTIDGGGPDEPNDSILTATPVPIFVFPRPEVYQTEGFLGDGPYAQTRGDRDFYAVRVLDEGKILTVDVIPAPGSELDPIVALYDVKGNRLRVGDNDGDSPNAHLTAPVTCVNEASDAPVAYILVMGTQQRFPADPLVPYPGANRLDEFAAGDGPGSTGAYELTIRAASSDTACGSEPDDTLSTARSTGIVDEGIYACTNNYLGDSLCPDPWLDVDVLSFVVVQAPASVEVTVSTCRDDSQYGYSVHVFDAAGQKIASQHVCDHNYYDAGEVLIATLDAPGMYYVGVSGDCYADYDPTIPCLGNGWADGTYDIAIVLTPGRVSSGFGGLAGGRAADEGTGPPVLLATRLDDASNVIDVLDADTGAVTTSFTAPERFGGAEGIAYDGSGLYYIGTGQFPKLYSLALDSGEVLDEYILWPGSGIYSDAVMLAGELFLLDLPAQSIHVMAPAQRRYLRTLRAQGATPITFAGGIAALAGPGRIYIAEAFNDRVIYEIDPRSGGLTNTLPAPSTRPTALAGIGDDLLFLADWRVDTVEIINREGAAVDSLTLSTGVGSLAGEASIGSFADFDSDGDVDVFDYGAFQRCFTGSNGDLAPGCDAADSDQDGDVDLADFTVFPSASTGP